MKRSIKIKNWNRILCLAVCSVFLLCTIGTAFGESVDELIKKANSDLRKAQNLMFSGKNDESSKLLKEVAKTLEEIKSADPENSQLKSLQGKYDKQKKDVDKKLGVGTTTTTTSQTSTTTTTSSSDKLPSGVTYRIKNINSALDKIENRLKQDSVVSKESKVETG